MLCINSSEISKLTGYNKYIKNEEFVNLFIKNLYKKRDDLKEYDENINNIQTKNDEERMKDLLDNLNIEDKKNINTILSTNLLNNTELIEQSNNLISIIEKSDISSIQKNKIINEVNSKINCNYGSNTEQKAIQKYEKETNNKVYANNDKCYTAYYENFLICGKIDGLIDQDGKTYINEIKNRRNHIYDSIPIYEKVQLLSYTKLLLNTNIIFTQCKDNDTHTEVFENYQDDEMWNTIIYRLEIYVNYIYNLRDDEKLRKEFLTLDIKKQHKALKKKFKWI